jgi:hypothetical protein
MTEGVTSRSGMRRGGFGLKTIRDLTTQRDGGIFVTSGQAKFEVRGKKATARLMRGVPAFHGTAIEIDFRPGLDVEISEEEVF